MLCRMRERFGHANVRAMSFGSAREPQTDGAEQPALLGGKPDEHEIVTAVRHQKKKRLVQSTMA